MKKYTKRDHYQEVTDKILSMLEAGTKPWECPWVKSSGGGIPSSYASKKEYHGVNIPLLWIAQEECGYSSSEWLTYKQAKERKGQVRKGERGETVFFYKTLEVHKEVDGEDKARKVPMLRSYTVFNLDQIDGIDSNHEPVELPGGFDPVHIGESAMSASGVTIHETGQRAFYRPATDEVTLPDRERFADAENFYATALHELTHATKHETRCDRPKYAEDSGFGSRSYAFEELVAELGSAFLMARLGLAGSVEGHASYIDHWRDLLKHDKKAFFRAAAKAQQAADWLYGQYVDALERLDEAA